MFELFKMFEDLLEKSHSIFIRGHLIVVMGDLGHGFDYFKGHSIEIQSSEILTLTLDFCILTFFRNFVR